MQSPPAACWDVHALQLGIVPARQGFYLQLSEEGHQMGSGFPRRGMVDSYD